MNDLRESLTQDKYGVFNPRFLGISLEFDSPANYDSALRYFLDRELDPAPGDLNRVYLLSVLDHETRHYHDFLLSPYSYRLFRLRLQAVANGSQVFNAAKSMSGTCLPIPMVRWLQMSDSERRRCTEGWRADIADATVPVTLPHLSRDELLTNVAAGSFPASSDESRFAEYAEATARAYARIEQLSAGFASPGRGVSPHTIHEVSALTSQVASVYRSQGIDEALSFISSLLDSKLPYATSWQSFLQLSMLFEKLATGGESPESLLSAVGRIQAVSTWSLLGSYDLDGPHACPTVRFSRLISSVVADSGNPSWSWSLGDDDDLLRAWALWDARTDVSPWRRSLEELRALSERGPALYRDLGRAWAGDHDIPDLLLSLVEDVDAYQRSVVEAFLADPGVLADPWRYVQSPPGLLPTPALRLELVGHAIDATAAGRARLVTRVDEGGKVYTSSWAIPGSADEAGWARLERALRFEELSEWCDLAFSEHSVPDHVVKSARRGLREISEKLPLAIIGSAG